MNLVCLSWPLLVSECFWLEYEPGERNFGLKPVPLKDIECNFHGVLPCFLSAYCEQVMRPKVVHSSFLESPLSVALHEILQNQQLLE